MGRKKIQIRKIENDRQKTVTFARRRAGLIKKAHEIAVLCGVKVGLLIFDQKEACHVYSSEGAIDHMFIKYFTKQFATSESKKRKESPCGDDINPTHRIKRPALGQRCVAVVNEYQVVSGGPGSADLTVKGTKNYHDPSLSSLPLNFGSMGPSAYTHLPATVATTTFMPITPVPAKPAATTGHHGGNKGHSPRTTPPKTVTATNLKQGSMRRPAEHPHTQRLQALTRTNSLPISLGALPVTGATTRPATPINHRPTLSYSSSAPTGLERSATTSVAPVSAYSLACPVSGTNTPSPSLYYELSSFASMPSSSSPPFGIGTPAHSSLGLFPTTPSGSWGAPVASPHPNGHSTLTSGIYAPPVSASTSTPSDGTAGVAAATANGRRVTSLGCSMALPRPIHATVSHPGTTAQFHAQGHHDLALPAIPTPSPLGIKEPMFQMPSTELASDNTLPQETSAPPAHSMPAAVAAPQHATKGLGSLTAEMLASLQPTSAPCHPPVPLVNPLAQPYFGLPSETTNATAARFGFTVPPTSHHDPVAPNHQLLMMGGLNMDDMSLQTWVDAQWGATIPVE
ncbi:hypothetical protein H4R34_000958 [Dimargaris verticillata]|uniref:MADS-box domain-containing protein n=1 Tax=Dimargaris verticillata TaxID=2761393 RepID=A0A9W8EE80_9FUNG|nr:hypothetical protein H4R34_000958 [Dimargaris verticillata]